MAAGPTKVIPWGPKCARCGMYHRLTVYRRPAFWLCEACAHPRGPLKLLAP